MEDDRLLGEFGISPANAKAENPFEIGLAMSADGSFEELEKTPYSSPPGNLLRFCVFLTSLGL